MSLWTVGLIALILLEVVAAARSQAAVRGSRQRYVWATARRTAAWLIIAGFITVAVIHMALSDTVTAVIYIAGATYNIWYETRRNDDDDWWSGTWRKAKRRAREFARSLGKAGTPATV